MNHPTTRLTSFAAVLTAALACAFSTAHAAPPPPFEGKVVALSDADTFTVERGDGSRVKVRLRWADAPEIAHNRRQVDQPGGREALDYAKRELLGEPVIVTPTGKSYDRIVAEVALDSQQLMEPFDVAVLLTMTGHAQLDPRYKPSERLKRAEALARKRNRGIWADPHPVPPWEWRAKVRDEQRARLRGRPQ